MRILFLAHRVPYPPDKGDKIRAFHELRGLADRGHEVHLLAFADERRDRHHAAALGAWCASVDIVPLDRHLARIRALGGLAGSTPVTLGYFASAAMRRRVERALAATRPDAIVVFSSAMAQYVPDAMASRTLVDLVDADSEKWRDYASLKGAWSWLYATEARRLRAYEEWILDRFACSVVCTDREAAVLRGAPGRRSGERLHIVANGVDLDSHSPGPGRDLRHLPPTTERGLVTGRPAPRVVFTGAMDYFPNVDAVRFFSRSVLPLVRTAEPGAEFLIVGHNPTAAVRRLARDPGVTVTGSVADVRPYFQAADVAIVPMRIARGTLNKVLEAMAAGCAVVATPVAVAGLALVPGTHVLIGSSPRDLANAVIELVRDVPLRNSLRTAARAFVEAHHHWKSTQARFARLVEDVAARTEAA